MEYYEKEKEVFGLKWVNLYIKNKNIDFYLQKQYNTKYYSKKRKMEQNLERNLLVEGFTIVASSTVGILGVICVYRNNIPELGIETIRLCSISAAVGAGACGLSVLVRPARAMLNCLSNLLGRRQNRAVNIEREQNLTQEQVQEQLLEQIQNQEQGIVQIQEQLPTEEIQEINETITDISNTQIENQEENQQLENNDDISIDIREIEENTGIHI